jgi:hypothetical protein
MTGLPGSLKCLSAGVEDCRHLAISLVVSSGVQVGGGIVRQRPLGVSRASSGPDSRITAGQDGVFVAVIAGQADRKAPPRKFTCTLSGRRR